MSGICGYVTKKTLEKEILVKMRDTMIHRGPDAYGACYLQENALQIGFAHRILSPFVSDKTVPLSFEDNRIIIAFDGKIYNAPSLKKELSPYPFRTDSEAEIILAAYKKWGGAALNRLDGAFALAIYDTFTKKLILAKDRLGEKPLYYYHGNGDFVFGSTLSPLMQFPFFPKNINQDILPAYLYHSYVPKSYSIFDNTFQLEPGHYLVFQNGEITKHCYWDLVECYLNNRNTDAGSFEDCKAKLKELIFGAIKKRIPNQAETVCTSLSGGYDSSLISAMTQSILPQKLKTFTIGFDVPKYNEAEYAKSIATHLGTEHTEMYFTEKELLEMLPNLPAYYDEPFADSSQLPTSLVSMLIKDKAPFSLSGDGGDELFCGYPKFLATRLKGKLSLPAKIIGGIINAPLIRKLNLIKLLPHNVRNVILNQNPKTKSQLYSHDSAVLAHKLAGESELGILFPEEERFRTKDNIQRLTLIYHLDLLPERMLHKADRANMSYSLDGCAPLLDQKIVEYSYAIPLKYKYNKKLGLKAIIKDIVYDYIPKELMERPKQGFTLPVDKWLTTTLWEQLSDLSTESYLKKQGLFSYDGVQTLLTQKDNAPSGMLWSYYMFQLWYEYHIKPTSQMPI